MLCLNKHYLLVPKLITIYVAFSSYYDKETVFDKIDPKNFQRELEPTILLVFDHSSFEMERKYKTMAVLELLDHSYKTRFYTKQLCTRTTQNASSTILPSLSFVPTSIGTNTFLLLREAPLEHSQ